MEPELTIRPFGPDAVLVGFVPSGGIGPPAVDRPGFDAGDWVALLDQRLTAQPHPAVVDVVPAAETVLVVFDHRQTDAVELSPWLQARWAEPDHHAVATAHSALELRVRYDGPDLDGLAHLLGRSVRSIIDAHLAATLTVAFCGFAPGFAYLRGFDLGVDVPRLASPRTRVPEGSVALAARYSAVYPRATPGGWQLIGTCLDPVWSLHADPPTALWPGRTVRFVEVP